MRLAPRSLLSSLAASAALVAPLAGHTALPDEIQVYTDDINAPGETGLELHLNTTPRGQGVASYPGEVVTQHGLRVTPEFSYGLTPSLEAGLYLPVVRSPEGSWYGAGAKLRLKWLPVRAENGAGLFAGVNFEWSQLAQRFSESRRALEVRTIVGHRSADWLFSANPVFGWDLSRGYRSGTPDFTLGLKGARRVSAHSFAGLEYYSGMGRLNAILPLARQDNTLFLAWDHEGAPFGFNFGIGRGLTSAADAWTVKAILELPL